MDNFKKKVIPQHAGLNHIWLYIISTIYILRERKEKKRKYCSLLPHLVIQEFYIYPDLSFSSWSGKYPPESDIVKQNLWKLTQ